MNIHPKICSEDRFASDNRANMGIPKRNGVILEAVIPRQSRISDAIRFNTVVKWIRGKISRTEDCHLGMLLEKTNPVCMNEISTNRIDRQAYCQRYLADQTLGSIYFNLPAGSVVDKADNTLRWRVYMFLTP